MGVECSTTTIMSPLPDCVSDSVLFLQFSNGFQSRSGCGCSRLVCFIPTEICF